MSDYNNNLNNNNENLYENQNENSREVYSSSESVSSETNAGESSYEWNADSSRNSSGGEYHYSYVNGNNENASHNPNNYENAYSSYNPAENATDSSGSQNNYSNPSYSNPSYSNSSSGYGSNSYYGNGAYNNQRQYGSYSNGSPQYTNAKTPKVKKPKKPASKGFVAAMLIISILCSASLGFVGGYAANVLSSKSSNGSINITKVESDGSSNTSNVSAGTTSAIVKKTADSVVEIATEGIQTGMFAQQYVVQGAGSGVIISEDGYIITNHHVIDGANNVKVTLRDGKTSYTAAVIGSDSDNDIALLKVDAKGLTPATFGNSSNLAVGDYVVAIGNPLGELGGTVTDGIISALAREVKIEDKNMTLLQTNAQISPGNSGGGLFNANGELVGIVNAKDSATEVEGIAFAIPVNNVLDIIDDLKSYGYVTGKIDLGMQLTDITSKDTAFYYGVSKTGCYVLSVTKGSNADAAGFATGDLITKVNGQDIASSADVEKALANSKVGDKVKFTVYRNGATKDINLTLAEYVPSGNFSNQQSAPANDNSDDIWSQMFGW